MKSTHYYKNLTDFALLDDGLKRVHDEPDGIGDGQHPDPLIEGLVPYEQLFNLLIDDDVDGVVDGGVLADGAD